MSDYYSDEECEEDYADAEAEQSPKVQYAAGFTFVNVYEVDRIYGGPEEGGWYYDAGTVVISRQVPETEAEAVAEQLRQEYPVGTGRSASYSVLYCGGDYRVYISGEPGRDYPEVTPHYE